MDIISLKEAFLNLKKDKNCLVLAHNYVDMSIQEVADYVGDSLQMAEFARKSDCEKILVCSIRIMGDTAKMLNPGKKVMMSHPDADCQLANMISPEIVEQLIKDNPEAEVVCYINTTKELRALSTVTCTSANCIRIVEALPADKDVYFIPDGNIGQWVEYKTGRELILFDSHCHAHHQVQKIEAQQVKEKYPDYTLLVHPECNPEISKIADVVCSTSQMIDYTVKNDKVIIGTELGLYEQLKSRFPEKKIVPLQERMICCDMKKITLEDAYYSLMNEENEIVLDPEIEEKCMQSLNRMHELLLL